MVLQEPRRRAEPASRGGRDERCGQEGVPRQVRENGLWGRRGGRVKSGGNPLYACRSQLLTARRLASPGPRGAKAADGAAATSGPWLTLFAASRRPAARPPAAALRGPKSKSRAAGAPTCGEAAAPSPPHPLARPGHFASLSRRRRARTLPRTPLR